MNRFVTMALLCAATATSASAQTYFNFGIATEGFVFNAGNAPAYPVLVTPAVAPVPAVIPMMPGYMPYDHHTAKHLRKAAHYYDKARRHYREAVQPRPAVGASFATPIGTIYVGAPGGYHHHDYDNDDYEDYYKHLRKHYKKHSKHHDKHHKHHKHH